MSLGSRSESPNETDLPFLNTRFICILQIKRNPCIDTKNRHPQGSEAFVTSPEQDVEATFIPLPAASCSAGVDRWYTGGLLSHDKSVSEGQTVGQFSDPEEVNGTESWCRG